MYVCRSLLVLIDGRACARMISEFAEILTWLLVVWVMHYGRHGYLVMAAIQWALFLLKQRCWWWMTVSRDTRGATSSLGGQRVTSVIAGRLWWMSASGRVRSVLLSAPSWSPLPWPSPVRLVPVWSGGSPAPAVSLPCAWSSPSTPDSMFCAWRSPCRL